MNQGSSSAMLREEEEYLGRRTRQGKTQDMRADKKPFALASELDSVKHPVGIGVLEDKVRAKQSSPLPALFPPHPPPSLLPLAVALALALALAIALAVAAPPPRYLLLLLLVHHRLSIASLSHTLLLNSSTSSSPSSFLRHASPPPDCLDSNLAWFCIHAPCLVFILLPSFSPSSFIPSSHRPWGQPSQSNPLDTLDPPSSH
ncbi:hypothetical protein CPAR01_05208 [Colletotrichum paranaense]|uniref:Uncharacterized protein n=1 Tax=Colletotrichum paranaense TaxID=1914294 RepID=A0ABQ9SS64_9PEZI|nr:uncharacterized protein CPAR01_05208 [Colletotrichum paranaense]KAK1541821.1 hypothetical protein CPAR01_05208 [Colletotrichum paranaense]